MTTKILALTDALGNLVRFVLLPGQRFDTVGVPSLIEGLAFDALIADKAFDSNAIYRRSRCPRRQGRHLPASSPRKTSRRRRGDVQMAASHREFLRQAQGVQTYCNARRQDRSKLRLHDPSRRSRDKLPMNPNRP